MMTNDDVPRGMPYQQGRKPLPPGKYQDTRYSPSTSYNYNYNSNSAYPSQQHLRRKMDNRFKRDNSNGGERLMRQNDLIIRLLKEIRDRLPPPPVSAPSAPVAGAETETVRQNGPAGEAEQSEAVQTEPQAAAAAEEHEKTDADAPEEDLSRPEPQAVPEAYRDGA
jgi:hypothetical protein